MFILIIHNQKLYKYNNKCYYEYFKVFVQILNNVKRKIIK